MLLQISLALALSFFQPSEQIPTRQYEFQIRLNSSVPLSRVANILGNRGRIASRHRGTPDYVIEIWPNQNLGLIRSELQEIPGVKLLQPLTKSQKTEASIQSSKTDLGAEANDLGYEGAHDYFLQLYGAPDGSVNWNSINQAREDGLKLPTFHVPYQGSSNNPFITPTWQYIGPTNLFGATNSSQLYKIGPCSGRIGAIAFDPKVSSTIYAAGANGGLWRSTDSGVNWTWLSKTWAQLDVDSIAIDPSNPKNILVGLGDYHYSRYSCHGFMRSTDGGITWNLIDTLGQQLVSSILFDPTNPKVVIAGTATSSAPYAGNIYRSVDSGATWKSLSIEGACNYPTLAATLPVLNKSRLYCLAAGEPGKPKSYSSRLLCSDDHGANWTRLDCPLKGYTTDLKAFNVVTSAVSASTIYLLSSQEKSLYISTDSGKTWQDKSTNLPAKEFNADNFHQADYDYYLACTKRKLPGANTFSDVLYLGLILLSESTDQGDTWSSVSGNVYPIGESVMHGDQHNAVFDPKNPNVALVGNDGGIYRVEYNTNSQSNVVTSLNKNLGITEFYKLSVHPSDPNNVLAGAQDNMAALLNGDPFNWKSVGGGDGTAAIIDPVEPKNGYAASAGLGVWQTQDGWNTFSDIHPTVSSFELTPFLVPMKLAPWSNKQLFTGTSYLYNYNISTNLWSVLGASALNYYAFMTAIELTPIDANRIYCASLELTNDKKYWVAGHLTMSKDGGQTFSEITMPKGGSITEISASTQDKADLIIARVNTDKKVLLRCKNVEADTPVWDDVTNNLPKETITSFHRDPYDPEYTWYVTTNSGIYQTADAGMNWTNAGTALGLPPVSVQDLAINPKTRDFFAATYGLGIWKLNIPPGNNKLYQVGVSPNPLISGTLGQGKVMLASPAGPNGATIKLTSVGQVTVPSSVSVVAGDYQATFPVTPKVVASTAKASVTATYANVTQTTNFTVVPASLQGILISPSTVPNGTTLYATISINGPAPAGGYKVSLSSSAPEAKMPSTVTIPAGQTSVDATVTTSAVSADKSITLTAKLGTVTKTATLNLQATVLKSLAIDQLKVVGGSDVTVTGTLTFSGPTLANGLKVALDSSIIDAARAPGSMTVKLLGSGKTATFVVTHFPVTSVKSPVFTATCNGVQKSVTVEVDPFLVTGISLNPTTVVTGNSVNGRVDLNASPNDKTGNIVIALNADNAAATVPATVLITPHASYGTFGIATPGTGTVNISATLNGQSSTAVLTITGLGLTALTLSPDTVSVGTGTQVTGTVSLGSPAPAGGALITLSSSLTTLANVPQSVTIPAGQTSATFQVRYTTLLTAQTTVTITAGYSGKQVTATLTLKP